MGNNNYGNSNNAVSGHDYNSQAGGFNTMNRRHERPGNDDERAVMPAHAVMVGVDSVDNQHDEWPKAEGDGRIAKSDVVGVNVTIDH